MELMAHIEAMPAVRAERLLDAAQVALYPQMKPDHAKPWWDRLVADAQDVVETTRQATVRGALFSFNGLRVGIGELKTKLAETLGGGLTS